MEENNISIKEFYTNNKEIIGMKQNEFFSWITENYYANCIKTGGKNRYVATSSSVEDGYMINKRKIIIDIDDFNAVISYNAYITVKGQEYFIELFRGKEEEK